MQASVMWIASAVVAVAAGLLWLGVWAWRAWRISQAGSFVEQQLQQQRVLGLASGVEEVGGVVVAQMLEGKADMADAESGVEEKPPTWLQSSWAQALLAQEDKALLEQAGVSLNQGAAVYVASRAILALLLPFLVVLLSGTAGIKALVAGFFGFGLGLMLPKWVMRSKAKKRNARVEQELPLLLDLLRLLQGVGLSIDQSLHILASEFSSVLKVLGQELAIANRLYASGRSREQSLQRLRKLGDNEDISAVVGLLVQVDRHGGAVQEPLKQFADRLREKRQASFKEKIGIITVKMTGVMVLTLLPALLVITAGPGFLSVIRSLSSLGGK